ncbi:DUF1080 domain-containing protein [Verrucomicrobia bacterium]|nr:DUF1080 domain-containing protein [Verrucomicrobiota bacterium]
MFWQGNKYVVNSKNNTVTTPLEKPFNPKKNFVKPPGWNDVRIVSVGNHVQLFLNGELANDIIDKDPGSRSTGDTIALQFRPNGAAKFEVSDIKYRSANAYTISAATTAPKVRSVASAFTSSNRSPLSSPVVELLPAVVFTKFNVSTGRKNIPRDPNQVFTLKNGELLVSGKEPGLLVTKQSFTNYHFSVEYRWDEDRSDRDSGVFVNTVGSPGKYVSLECNLLGPSKGLSGQLYLFGKGRKQLKVGDQIKRQGAIQPNLSKTAENPVGQWNKMDVLCDYSGFRIEINGEETVSGIWPEPRSGRIMLQSNRGAIRFRNAKAINYDATASLIMKLAMDGKVKEAAHSLKNFLDAEPEANETIRGLWMATLYAAAGDVVAHANFCREFMGRYPGSTSNAEVERPAKAYLVSADANDPALLSKAYTGVKFATRLDKGKYAPNWFSLSRGMAEYRYGNYSETLKWVQNASFHKDPIIRTPALAFRAMASFQQKQPGPARRFLSQAESSFKQLKPKISDWNNAIAAKLALDEAKSLIK